MKQYDYVKARTILGNCLPEDFSCVDTSESTNLLISDIKYANLDGFLLRFEFTPWIKQNLQKLILLKEKLLKKKKKI